MASYKLTPSSFKGTILSQPSKSMAHRAVICGALAKGESTIENIVLSDDIKATLRTMSAMGFSYALKESCLYPGRHQVVIQSSGSPRMVEEEMDCGESGSTARFIMPITRLDAKKVRINGHGGLVKRPFGIYGELFGEKGVTYRDENGMMPITLEGRLKPGIFTLPGNVSSQFVSGLLFALPLLEGNSEIHITGNLESVSYIHMTLTALNEAGIKVEASEDCRLLKVPGNQSYRSLNTRVEGDWSQAAFFCVLGVLHGSLRLTGLKKDSIQGDRAIVSILEAMGGSFTWEGDALVIEKSSLKGIEIDVSQCPDLVPVLAVAGAMASGTTRIVNGARLRIKESDRLMTTCRELNRLGAKIEELPDGLVIRGVEAFSGGEAESCGDHRIIMALAVAASVGKGEVLLHGCEAVAKSYPEFWEDYESLGGKRTDA